MLYQLSNGKTIYLSVEDFLNLTDEDIQYLISTGQGSDPVNPFHGSALSKKGKTIVNKHDTSIDYQEKDDNLDTNHSIDLDNLPD